jgi:hypothetical protein
MDQYAATRVLAEHLSANIPKDATAAKELLFSLFSIEAPEAHRDAWVFRSRRTGPNFAPPTWYLVLGQSVVAYEADSLTDEAAYELAARHNDQDLGA